MNLVDLVVCLERLLIGFFFKPEVMITEHLDFIQISAAFIFETIPPFPNFDALPAISLIFLVIDVTSRTRSSLLFSFGGSL